MLPAYLLWRFRQSLWDCKGVLLKTLLVAASLTPVSFFAYKSCQKHAASSAQTVNDWDRTCHESLPGSWYVLYAEVYRCNFWEAKIVAIQRFCELRAKNEKPLSAYGANLERNSSPHFWRASKNMSQEAIVKKLVELVEELGKLKPDYDDNRMREIEHALVAALSAPGKWNLRAMREIAIITDQASKSLDGAVTLEGMRAWRLNVPDSENPYPEGTAEYYAWHDGWYFEEQEEEREREREEEEMDRFFLGRQREADLVSIQLVSDDLLDELAENERYAG